MNTCPTCGAGAGEQCRTSRMLPASTCPARRTSERTNNGAHIDPTADDTPFDRAWLYMQQPEIEKAARIVALEDRIADLEERLDRSVTASVEAFQKVEQALKILSGAS